MRRRSFLQLGLAGAFAAAGCARAAALPATGAPRRFALSAPDRRFGGFSALHLAPNGRDLLLLSDRGALAALRLSRDDKDHISGAEFLSLTPLKPIKGDKLHGFDSEGLARDSDGSLFISFEGSQGGKIWRYASPDARPTAMPFARDFASLPRNGGFEALTLDTKGRLLAIPEEPRGDTHPLYRLEGKSWREIGSLARQNGFKPVSLDRGPDGEIYLLERATFLPIGFRARISRLHLEQLLRREVLWQSALGAFGNLEGLSMTTSASGKLRATMVADDNMMALLPNELVELELDESTR